MDNRINILFVMTGQPHIFGGGKRVFMQIMKGLPKETFNVLSCCSLSTEQEDELRASGVRIITTHLSEYNPIIVVLELSKIYRSEKIHIVHSQGGRAVFYSRMAARFAKSPVVVNTSTMLVEHYDVGLAKKAFYTLCDRMTEGVVDRFIAVSESLREDLVTHHRIHPDKVLTIYNGIELDQYKARVEGAERVRREFLMKEDQFLVGTIGRLVYQKGLDSFLKAVPKVLDAFPNTTIVLIGDGPLKGELESLSKELGVLEKCIFAGFREDIRDILSALDVFALPSILEGHPVVILEAMAMEKPIVATDINGVREGIENGRTGILVPPGDPQALGEAINEFLKDGAKGRKFGMEARKQVEEMFDLKRQVALHEEAYKALLRGKGIKV